jgi:hypothetical protein
MPLANPARPNISREHIMKTHTPHRSWVLAPLMLAPLVPLYAADNDPASRVRLEAPKENLNRISVGYAAGWGFKATFERPSGSNRGPGPATGGGVDRFYDDGYNRVDQTGNASGYTSFWGYKNDSQLDAANDRLLMHSTRSTGGKMDDVEDDPQHGFQLTFNRQLGRVKDQKWAWGLEAAFGWTPIDIDASGKSPFGTRTITDAYNLNGVRPPWVGGNSDPQYAGHAGTFEGPGTLIEDSPTRTITRNPIAGSRRFEADFYYLHLGPYIEMPISGKWSAVVSAGLSLGLMDGQLHFNELVANPTTGTTRRERGHVDDADVLVGGFLNATLNYALNEKWSVFAGGQFQSMSSYEAEGKGRKVTLDLTINPYAVAGVSYSF